jgi:hypothetical protein
MDKYICTRCGGFLSTYEYENFVCLCFECNAAVKRELENQYELNNIDMILENKRKGNEFEK